MSQHGLGRDFQQRWHEFGKRVGHDPVEAVEYFFDPDRFDGG